MKGPSHNRQRVLIAALVTLALRALTPDGYMPGSVESGLVYELCPEGMPVAIMQALGGDHHHHEGGDGSSSVSGTEQCPIGHMLASAVALDIGSVTAVLPNAQLFDDVLVATIFRVSLTAYRSRAPPA